MNEVRHHPARRHPVRSVLILALLVAISMLLGHILEPVTATALCLILWGSLHEFFLPNVYRVEGDRLFIRRGLIRQRVPLKRFRSVVQDRHGLLLSPYRKPHRMESFRGLFLPLDERGVEQLTELLTSRIDRGA